MARWQWAGVSLARRSPNLRRFACGVALAWLGLLFGTQARAGDDAAANGLAAGERLARIVAQRQLRVCTAGDNWPYAYIDATSGVLAGIDIELLRLFGRQFDAADRLAVGDASVVAVNDETDRPGEGVEVVFVRSRWPDLTKNLASGACDLAIGGITVQPQRTAQFTYSLPVAQSGIVALTRCAEAERFASLAQIDALETRVLVTPGGREENFARTRLRLAQIAVRSDTPRLFEALLQGGAELLLADSDDALLLEKRYPGLCAARPEQPLSVTERAFLLPVGEMALKERVDGWLRRLQADGRLQSLVAEGRQRSVEALPRQAVAGTGKSAVTPWP